VYCHLYNVFPAIESTALGEKLLNDLLKTTEGFQRLKKMNEGMQKQVSASNVSVRNSI
jgi:hypothetical protein